MVLKHLGANVDIDEYAHSRTQFLNVDRQVLGVPLCPHVHNFSGLIQQMEVSPQPTSLPNPLSGTASLPWLLERLGTSGQGGFAARHHRWSNECGAKRSLPALYEHEVLSLILDHAMTVD